MSGATRSHQPARPWTVIGIVLLLVMPRGPSAASLSRYVVALEAEASTGEHTEPPLWAAIVGRLFVVVAAYNGCSGCVHAAASTAKPTAAWARTISGGRRSAATPWWARRRSLEADLASGIGASRVRLLHVCAHPARAVVLLSARRQLTMARCPPPKCVRGTFGSGWRRAGGRIVEKRTSATGSV